MATYEAVVKPVLEYASSVWSSIASSTSINKLQVMQNAALRTARGCTQDTDIHHLYGETLTLPMREHLQLHASQCKRKAQHPSHPLRRHTTYFNTPRLREPTRGNGKILHTPPPHIGSSEERLPHFTRRTLAQLRTNKSLFLKSYLHKVDAGAHPSPLCPLCNIHTHDTHHLFNCTHIRTTLSPLDLWTDPAGVTALRARWTEKLAGGPQAGTSDSPH